ncbi:hypothetical protein P7C70_g915, partial [Phenoliferia sp. Uapishka_3]
MLGDCLKDGGWEKNFGRFARIWIRKGELITSQKVEQKMFGARAYNGHRGEMHKILWDHALSLGVEIRCSSNVSSFWETETSCGVICNGETVEADVVVGADGVRSNARKLVLGYEDKPKPSGYAIYRAWFDAKSSGIADDPLTSMLVEGGKDHFYGWIGEDVHFLASSLKGGQDVSYVITHKDDADIEESWQFPVRFPVGFGGQDADTRPSKGKMEDVLKIVEGWDPRCAAILSKAPSVVDWKLVHRDPLVTWVSPLGRCALIGDAAHPFLPTSIQGASQAMEDGVTLACTLKQAGKGSIPLAVRAFEAIRYGRVRRAQLGGVRQREAWHKTLSEDAKKNPEKVMLPREEWLLGHDSEKHAFEAYPAVAKELELRGYSLPVLPTTFE